MLNKNFVVAGNATFTVVSGQSGEHMTFKVSHPDDTKPYFVNLLMGSNNETDYQCFGLLDTETGFVKLTRKAREILHYTDDTKAVKVVRWALNKIWTNSVLPTGYDIKHEGKCCCCGRKLTTPESLDLGIGPECLKKAGW